MIEQLSVKDYVLFDHAVIDFKDRTMSVITGETGAGKSLLIDAIGYLSGGRLPRNVVRKGAQRAVLQMVLSHPNAQVKALLEENGYELEEDEELIITRTITSAGKSRITINDQTSTNGFVRKITDLMIDVHSQMDTLKLMDPDVQLELLDRFAKTDELRQQTAEAFDALSKIAREIRKLKTETFSDAELEKLTRELNEIREADPKEGELEELEKRIEEAEAREADREALAEVIYLMRKDTGVLDQLSAAARALKNNGHYVEQADKLNDAYFTLSEVQDELENAKEQIDGIGASLDDLQEREFTLKKLYRKYGGSYENLKKTEKAHDEAIERILHRQDVFDRLEKQRKAALARYAKAARALSAKRQASFEALQQKVEENARDLMLEHARFVIERKEKKLAIDGIDQLEFMVAMNPGQPFTPLKQSASGGELSRLMLAMKVVFQAQGGVGTLVFDEIDTGVSGKVALSMGGKMHDLAENYQVLCITHLASVAVWADEHFHVAKSSDGDSTRTTVSELNEDEHVRELAIMTNGSASESAVESMKDLVQEVRHGKSALSH